ncbi:MAG: glutamate racemase [bacterium]|nr:glutamate racemase [bacterium]
MASNDRKSRPIGIFDSGIGGLTVAKAIAEKLPNESIWYFGDSKRCPYGPRPLEETRGFVRQICSWLLEHDVKLIIIACNTATAAGLEMAQRVFDVPILGVVEPGARAAMRATRSRRVGVIATTATVESGAYESAIKRLDAGIKVFSAATPKFVDIVEESLHSKHSGGSGPLGALARLADDPEHIEIANGYLHPLKERNIDTLVMGCTHFPFLEPLISQVMGPEVQIISSATETANDVYETLERRGHLAKSRSDAFYRFATTADDLGDFEQVIKATFENSDFTLEGVGLDELEALTTK